MFFYQYLAKKAKSYMYVHLILQEICHHQFFKCTFSHSVVKISGDAITPAKSPIEMDPYFSSEGFLFHFTIDNFFPLGS
jgi:hypothetical protein